MPGGISQYLGTVVFCNIWDIYFTLHETNRHLSGTWTPCPIAAGSPPPTAPDGDDGRRTDERSAPPPPAPNSIVALIERFASKAD